MSKLVTYDERKCIVQLSPNQQSSRFIHICYYALDKRFVCMHYLLSQNNRRICYTISNPLYNERKGITGERCYGYSTYKQIPYLITPDNDLLVKTKINPKQKVKIIIDVSGTNKPNPDTITLFDGFNEGKIDTNKWSKTATNIELKINTIVCSDGNTNLTTISLGKLTDFCFGYKAIQYDDASRWSCTYHDEVIDSNDDKGNDYKTEFHED